MAINKLHNDYAAALGALFDEMPKAVIAAIAVSLASEGGNSLDDAPARIATEWDVLYLNGIVPQRPPATVRALIRPDGI